ncbi:bifunctional UDP-N-acetylglucosamine diphosphorylase/glucosamine-1-phosphate N-acetyltransferase GlmU [Albimonas sp. CAU 1670]|uniref:bifunctional UDP-N-acetylglucosamine diphosphorylase/glucosamine-1-phosphate N-acetyltransferase GlmU n=1 Tax=Albimonas sp. CAU 1670 TaxID=3032599 RepID=UPI0023DBC4CF|nr:bifunctional UDP-N-acetylglucosamine diphosphorylase/glucosamine-1-phosphate N-acetyltransferase GlmU [Albimonas sp. CAU 1670]MDF2233416.1 bifunctional UDP-N-acetylglucosamine diphosphorylase/glucosamine-1-phosphate N-acetyltransferase GlmU [Albimonas sp. CAU 1670]
MTRPDASRDLTSSDRPVAVVVLAAGQGTRMRSALPKVLHKVGGAPMLAHVLRTAQALAPERVVVVTSPDAPEVGAAARALRPDAVDVPQRDRLGTAHAALQAREALAGFEGDVLVLYGDTPLVRPESLAAMSEARAQGAAVVVLGFHAADPAPYGRLIVENGELTAIVEAKEATPEQLEIAFSNSGVMCIDGARMWDWLDRVSNDNAKGEYYLTDLVAIARADGAQAAAVECPEAETLGVNSRVDLAAAEAAFQARRRLEAMEAGVTLTAPETVFFALDTEIAPDVEIGPNVVFGPGVRIETGVEIRAFCHLEGCTVATGAILGPYARLRPGAEIGPDAHVGNFVEVKNSILGAGAKANHLTYIGDADVGARTNVGAGTITCNYDGFLKHRTVIGADAFIGSNTALVAPVEVGEGASVGAGSVVVEDVPAHALAVARGAQEVRPGAAKRLRERLAAEKAARKG